MSKLARLKIEEQAQMSDELQFVVEFRGRVL